MTSEVENILSGEVVRKEGTDKAIGVSSANLMPDERGEVPLSKQSAFQIEPVQTPLPETVDTVESEPELTEALDLTPEQPTEEPEPVIEPVAPTVPETPFAAEAPVAPEAPAPVEEPTIAEPAVEVPTDNLTAGEAVPEPVAAPEGDVITEAPVEVTAPTELGTVDFESIIPNIPLVSDEAPEEVAQTTADAPGPAVELPEMPAEIMAEAPTTVDNNLFVDAPEAPGAPEAPAVSVESELSETPITDTKEAAEPLETLDTATESLTVPEVVTDSEEPLFDEGSNEPVDEEALFPGDLSEPAVKFDNQTSEEAPSAPELPQAPVEEQLDTLEGIPGLDLTGEESLEELGSTEEPLETLEDAPVEGVEVAKDGAPVVNYGELAVDSAKLDTIIEKLNNISESLEDIRTKFDISRGTQVLPQEAVAVEAPVIDPTVEAVPQAPAKQEEFVDALSQIPGYEEAGVDETPIKGGMFI